MTPLETDNAPADTDSFSLPTYDTTSSAPLEIEGDADQWRVLWRIRCEKEQWVTTAHVLSVRAGTYVQITTQQLNPDGSHAISDGGVFFDKTRVIEGSDGHLKLT